MNVLRGAKDYVTGALGLGSSGETSGALDVMVVQHEDGVMCCTPFHVRFAKVHPRNSKERVVQLRVNGQTVSLCMKLGAAGEAFFVERVHNPLRQDLVTSPLTSPLHAEEGSKDWESPPPDWVSNSTNQETVDSGERGTHDDPWHNYQLLSDLSSDEEEPMRSHLDNSSPHPHPLGAGGGSGGGSGSRRGSRVLFDDDDDEEIDGGPVGQADEEEEERGVMRGVNRGSDSNE
ncbi:unnamed protein product, partial [Discosporangium mesarthrocarpum]